MYREKSRHERGTMGGNLPFTLKITIGCVE